MTPRNLYSFFLLMISGMLLEAVQALSKGDNAGVPPTAAPMNIIVIGGSSGMGKAAAIACVQRGGKVMIVSRSSEKLAKAAEEIQFHSPSSHSDEEDLVVETATLDATDEEAVEKFVMERLATTQATTSNLGDSAAKKWDGLVVSAAGKAPHGPLTTLPTASTRDLFESKFWSAYHCAKHIGPILRSGGGVVFVAGVLNRRPGMNCAPLATTNGALEGLTRALALEWGPNLRVNCLVSIVFCGRDMQYEKLLVFLSNNQNCNLKNGYDLGMR